MEEMLMMLPDFCFIMVGRTAFMQRNWLLRLVAITASQHSMLSSSIRTQGIVIPALATRTSTRPNLATVSSAICWMVSALVMSAVSASTSCPYSRTTRTVSSRAFLSRPTQITSAPYLARVSQKALPSPRLPPVTMATLPVRSKMFLSTCPRSRRSRFHGTWPQAMRSSALWAGGPIERRPEKSSGARRLTPPRPPGST